MEQIIKIIGFVVNSFIHIWPYLLITIPLAVVVNLSGAARHITRAFGKNPLLSVLLATIVGAFSPFCSCGVIPVISSLLIGGVPLAPVMSFWIASPSMDPEIFFLSSSVLGWKLAIWRLSSTFIISLLAGYITHYVTINGYIGNDILRTQSPVKSQFNSQSLVNSIRFAFFRKKTNLVIAASETLSGNYVCCEVAAAYAAEDCSCSAPKQEISNPDICKQESLPLIKRILPETFKATLLVAKFMGFAFLITALITFYLPDDVISWIVRVNPSTQVTLATLIGIPMYTSNITALPLAGGLIDLGMNKGAALSFLIAGATTTLPAMVAVWGITKRKVFLIYLSFVLFGALLSGLFFNLFS